MLSLPARRGATGDDKEECLMGTRWDDCFMCKLTTCDLWVVDMNLSLTLTLVPNSEQR